MKRKIFIFVAIVAALMGVGYWVFTKNFTSAQQGGKITDEEMYTLEKTKLVETLTLSGSIDAEEQVTLGFPTGGKLAWVGVKEGDVVEKYQGIASLDQRDLQKRLESSLNTFMISRWDFDQTGQDNKEAPYKDGDLGDRMKRIIDKAQFNLNNAVINVELQSLAKEYSYLYTPIEGIVTKVGAPYAGVTIGVTTTYEVVNPATTFFSATADQTEVPNINIGQRAKIVLDAYPEETLQATVKSVSYTPRQGDTGTTYEVKLDFPTSTNVLKYRMGMTGDVEFVTKQKSNVLVVPVAYVRTEMGEKYVTVLTKEGRKEKTKVEVGEEGDSDVEILKGLSVGDVVVEEQ